MGSLPLGLSASRGAAILGLSKWATPFSVWQDIKESMTPGFNAEKGYLFEKFEGNNATAFGTAFEDSVILLAEQRSGNLISDREGVYSANGADYVTCHIDGRYDQKTLHEGKTTNARGFGFSWGEPGTDRVPQEIQVQAQHQMLCSGAEKNIVSVLVFPHPVDDYVELDWSVEHDSHEDTYMLCGPNGPGDYRQPLEWAEVFRDIGNFHQYNIEAKPDTQKLLLEMYEDFWSRYIIGDEIPDAVDYEDIKRQFVAPRGTLVVKEDIADLMRTYKDITKEIGSGGYLAKRKKFLKTQILKFAKDQTTVEDDDCVERIVFRDEQGKKVGSYDGKTYRG